MIIKGRIKVIMPTVQVTEKFAKRDFVVTTDEMYPQHILMQFTQDKCSLLDLYKVDDEVEVAINIKGREYTTKEGEIKYFTTIESWRINNLNQQPHQGGIPSEASTPKVQAEQVNTVSNNEEEDDDSLPF